MNNGDGVDTDTNNKHNVCQSLTLGMTECLLEATTASVGHLALQ
jgi:hypothetical protein